MIGLLCFQAHQASNFGNFPTNLEHISSSLFTFSDKSAHLSEFAWAKRCRLPALGFLAILVGAPSVSTAMELPSGVDAELHEVLVEEIGGESWIRFRFLAPDIDRTRANAPAFSELERDFSHICTSLALPYLETHGLKADRVVISISDRVVEFGVSNPDSTQYFEQFRLDGGACIWEAF